jgi:hypothetical protein
MDERALSVYDVHRENKFDNTEVTVHILILVLTFYTLVFILRNTCVMVYFDGNVIFVVYPL